AEVKKTRQQLLFRKALQERDQLQEPLLRLDPELEDNDTRLADDNLANSVTNDAAVYTHPDLESFPDEETKRLAQDDYDLLMDSFTIN
ncbi:hypothetical protein BGX23_003662, partial [Mortierella sp. AD031]